MAAIRGFSRLLANASALSACAGNQRATHRLKTSEWQTRASAKRSDDRRFVIFGAWSPAIKANLRSATVVYRCRAVAARFVGCLLVLGSLADAAHAAVLPEDRADALLHTYDGGGVSVVGPSVLVRKSIKDTVSVYANYYADMITSASIDVLASGSKYSEERIEHSVGVDYLVDRAILSAGYTSSREDDYESDTFNLGVSQDFFGDMTTLSLKYAQSDDIIMKNDDSGDASEEDEFPKRAQRRRFSLGLTQVLTKTWIIALNAESVIDDGYLSNPYRNVRYSLSPNADGEPREVGTGEQEERYPGTRNSDAIGIRSMHYLPYRASLRLEARVFSDSWGIRAQNYEVRYTHPIRSRLIMELKARTYSQTQAEFYSDLFPYRSYSEHMGRDKELSAFGSYNLGLGMTYEMIGKLPFADKQSLSLYWDYLQFDYDNFRNQLLSRSENGETAQYNPGEEPAYSFEANVIRFFISVYY